MQETSPNISDWTTSELTKFIRDLADTEPPTESTTLKVDELEVTGTLTLNDQVVHIPFLQFKVGESGNIAFKNSWVNYGSPKMTARYWKDHVGYVHVDGVIKTGTTGTVCFTLPPGFRPSADIEFLTPSSVGTANITVASGGDVTVTAAGVYTWIGLSGIVFRTD